MWGADFEKSENILLHHLTECPVLCWVELRGHEYGQRLDPEVDCEHEAGGCGEGKPGEAGLVLATQQQRGGEQREAEHGGQG